MSAIFGDQEAVHGKWKGHGSAASAVDGAALNEAGRASVTW
ncbi:MAG: hypothetical protein P8J17_13465 [Halioglobus sp.]|nr:hypothetical protein [Halioglobus sp.]